MNKMAARSKGVVSPVDLKRHQRDTIKKASYYVWFLGAKECRGISGDEYVHPAVRQLIEKENSVEPLKVTLQVSSKGLKIIHNNSTPHVTSKSGGNKSSKDDQPLKHFVPDNNICYVTQETSPNDDIVACIVLITVTKFPLHVHVYRCDSVETATVLRQHLQSLIERPENQKTVFDIEQQQQQPPPPRRQQPPPMIKRPNVVNDKVSLTQPVPTSHLRSVRESQNDEHNSESSGGGGGGGSNSSGGNGGDGETIPLDERMSGLYLSLTAELREKLENRKNNGPILFPPKDYDLTLRRLRDAAKRPTILNSVIPSSHGARRSTERGDSSGKSSGIGSDEAPSSPTHERGNSGLTSSPTTVLPSASRQSHKLHNDSSSDEDEHWHSDDERVLSTVTKPSYVPPQRDAKRSSSSQPIIVNVDPANESLHHSRNNIWPPVHHNKAGGRPTLSPSRSHGEHSSSLLRYDDSRLLRNGLSASSGRRYHELPEEKRYPGLDRETAASLPFNANERSEQAAKKVPTQISPVREYDWDRQLRNYVPTERIHADEQDYNLHHQSMKRSIKPKGIKNNSFDDERKYYRYS
ncbi:hypothetical protein CHUAL_005465 [Chamberlinius hualienensis]